MLGLATIPALLVISAVFWFMGRERRTGYDREYEQEPPTDTEPALVPTLLRQGGEAGSYEFTATLFDLVRRGVYKAVPTTTERPIWGGLRHETVSDLELSAGKDGELRAWERDVANVVDGVLDGGSERLSRFRDQIEDERETMHGRFTAFKEHVADEAGRLSWFRSTGAIPLVVAVVLFALVGGLLVFFAVRHWRPVYPRYSDILLVGIGACMIANAALCLGTLVFNRRAWRRRTQAGEEEAERWDAFRRYLSDFPRLQEAPPATLALWERYLVYGIAFGIAERVLQGAQLHMPEALHEASSIYWISTAGDLGSGADEHVDRRPRVGVRKRARATELGFWRRRWRLLGRWWRRRGWRRRWLRLAAAAPKLVERDRSGRRHVQRLGVAGRRNRRLVTLSHEELSGRPSRSEPSRSVTGGREVDIGERLAAVRDECDLPIRDVGPLHERHSEDRASRGTQRPRPRRIGAFR